jgi:ATP-dependent Lon protease
MKPEAIDVDVKVVIIGETEWYYRLYDADDDFKKIFKVRADFDTVMPRDEAALVRYAEFIKKICSEENLLPFDRSGVAAVIEHGVRLAGRQSKISTRFSDVADLVREAHFWAHEKERTAVSEAEVDQAIAERIERSRLQEEKIQEMIDNRTLLVETEGAKVGQVNGLSINDLGDYSFGKPSKITSEVGMGRAGIINIEREAGMSGKTHNKGVAIISGYLRGKYAQDKPLSMSASVAFEQSYAGVDGDSASSTEIYAILSALSGLPLRQDIAVTGSVNQKGEIQPIGGVNQKIEGFFDVCKARRLTGHQGVMIPAQNVEDLMLRKDVVEAVRQRRFHIFPIQTIDEGIELLTGTPAGRKNADGKYPEDSVHFLADIRMRELAEGMKAFEKNSSAG